MMEKFRNLSNNIFFKIFLGFLGLTFVMFGVSSFILGGKNSWVAKVGSKTISYDKFVQTAQNDKEAIYRSSPNKEVMKYLNSDQFKQDVLGRMVTRNLVESLQQEFQIYPDKNLILKEIAANPGLKDKDGKFDRALYQNFLKSNNLTEKQHIDDLADEIVGGLIVQALAQSPNASEKLAKDLYQHRFQTRNADLVTISVKNIGNINNPNDFELNGFFDQNKDKFALPELRQVSFISFDINNLKQEIKISDEEINQEYQANKSEYQTAELANFYHILFAEEAEAKAFYQSLKTATADPKADQAEIFLKLATANGKDKSAILLTKVNKKELPSEIANPAFALNKNQYSDVIKSKLGFHIFYLLEKTPAADIPLAKVKDQIKAKLLASKEESQVRDNLKNVEDEILATNSLEKVAAKLNVAINKNLPKFAANGLDVRQNPVVALNNLDNFTKNSFGLEKGKVSKIFASESNKKYYIILVEEIDASRKRSLDEVKVAATDLWIASKKQQKMRELASEISKKINQNGGNAAAIIAQNGLKLEKNHSFPRFYMIDAGGGRKVPYANKLLNEIFALKINQATNPEQISADEMVIAIVRSIQNPAANNNAVKMITQDMENNFRNDILTSFNQYVQKQFPVQINQKLMQAGKDKAADEQ
ncbi:MAG: SurA N-terminal domain-containing protein [Pseudomonadota bacterium]